MFDMGQDGHFALAASLGRGRARDQALTSIPLRPRNLLIPSLPLGRPRCPAAGAAATGI
jgi:hypothetical protein